MPAREWFSAQEREATKEQSAPQPAAEPQPEPPVSPSEPKPGLSDSQRAQIRLLLEVTRRALNTPTVTEEQPPAEDPAVTRHKQILSGETKPENLSELARAARWALQNRDQIEGN